MNMLKEIKIFFLIIIFIFLGNNSIFANGESSKLISAKIIEVQEVRDSNNNDDDIEFSQNVVVQFDDGDEKDILNTYIPLEINDKVFIDKIEYLSEENNNVTELNIVEINRTAGLLILVILFLVVVFTFMGKDAIKSILSLILSIVIILYMLVPKILDGGNIFFWSILFVVFILAIVMFFTHGFNKKTMSAFLGTLIAIVVTGIMSYVVVNIMRFSGLSSDSAFNLHMAGIDINFSDLLLSGILIGIIGILDDVAITQASIVEELKKMNVSSKEIYKKAMVIGKEHIGALLNTLVLAYLGAFFPLILWFYNTQDSIDFLLSKEIIASEIVRVLIGSIGLILSVPLVTFISIFLINKKRIK